MNGITHYILLITLLIYGSRAPAQNVKQEIDSVTMNKPLYLAIRTNMIYDALLIPNLEWNSTWASDGRLPPTPCMAGGTTTEAIGTGEPTVVM